MRRSISHLDCSVLHLHEWEGLHFQLNSILPLMNAQEHHGWLINASQVVCGSYLQCMTLLSSSHVKIDMLYAPGALELSCQSRLATVMAAYMPSAQP